MSTEEDGVVQAALSWWKGRRPCASTLRAHLLNPTINTNSDSERAMARACAELISKRMRKKGMDTEDETKLLKATVALENIRLYVTRHSAEIGNADIIKDILRFCAEGGSFPSVLRDAEKEK